MNNTFNIQYAEDEIITILKLHGDKILKINREDGLTKIFSINSIITLLSNGPIKIQFYILSHPNFSVLLVEKLKSLNNFKEIILLDAFCYKSKNTLEIEKGPLAFKLAFKKIYDKIYDTHNREQMSFIWMANTDNFDVEI